MARVTYVTRSKKISRVEYMGLDISTGESFKDTVTLGSTFKNEAKLLSALKDLKDTDTKKVVAILDVSVYEALYGATEADFYKVAVPLNPATRRPY